MRVRRCSHCRRVPSQRVRVEGGAHSADSHVKGETGAISKMSETTQPPSGDAASNNWDESRGVENNHNALVFVHTYLEQ